MVYVALIRCILRENNPEWADYENTELEGKCSWSFGVSFTFCSYIPYNKRQRPNGLRAYWIHYHKNDGSEDDRDSRGVEEERKQQEPEGFKKDF